ncbi:hypothetical protein [Sorangium sp. So ce1024]|uniref:hypothetical protein n=1 Tax=Sorangium sp. So ce1024 TaxID=3133327 RepID=UPI003F106BA2
MRKTAFSFGCYTLSVDDELIIFRCDAPLPSGVKPVLHRGMRADHLTIPLTPRYKDPDAGSYWIHLTYPDGHHEPIATVRPEELRAFGEAMEDLVLRHLACRMGEQVRRIDLAWLNEQGYKILFYDPAEFAERLEARFQQKRRHYRISMRRIEDLAEDLWIADPEILDEEAFRALSLDGVHATRPDGESETLLLAYKPDGLGGQAPGWYAFPKVTADERLLAELERHSGYRLGAFLRTVCTELGLPVDLDIFEGILAL